MNTWKRSFWFYRCEAVEEFKLGSKSYTLTVYRKLDFISYHLIKLIHGKKKLQEMAQNLLGSESGE